jgi:hypothetical protein
MADPTTYMKLESGPRISLELQNLPYRTNQKLQIAAIITQLHHTYGVDSCNSTYKKEEGKIENVLFHSFMSLDIGEEEEPGMHLGC